MDFDARPVLVRWPLTWPRVPCAPCRGVFAFGVAFDARPVLVCWPLVWLLMSRASRRDVLASVVAIDILSVRCALGRAADSVAPPIGANTLATDASAAAGRVGLFGVGSLGGERARLYPRAARRCQLPLQRFLDAPLFFWQPVRIGLCLLLQLA